MKERVNCPNLNILLIFAKAENKGIARATVSLTISFESFTNLGVGGTHFKSLRVLLMTTWKGY